MNDFIVEEDAVISELLKDARTIAVVGASTDQYRDSNMIAHYLINKGYEVFPVNPKYEEVLDRKCYPSVASIGKQIDIVDVFRRSEFLEEVAKDAVSSKARVLWMQLGIENEEAARYAADNGLQVVMNRCIMVEHRRLVR
ncbi:MAG: CoA-binding protein [Bacteroidetes bacterium]|nr:CoA-binding protein [Bacteroidota bacterium]MCL5266951.1 CoA-binding protein [Bacteroidota bacterium]